MLEFAKPFFEKPANKQLALEVGPGDNPILNESTFHQTIFIDNEFQETSKNKINENFLTFKSQKKFDLIYDRLCWHEQNKNDWHLFLKNIIHHLMPGGLFISEHAIFHNNLLFEETYLSYNQLTNELKNLRNKNSIRFIPESRYIENCLMKSNLEIKYFTVPFGTKVILERSNTQIKNTDPDLLKLIAKKPL